MADKFFFSREVFQKLIWQKHNPIPSFPRGLRKNAPKIGRSHIWNDMQIRLSIEDDKKGNGN
jgi:hypothetical protein